MANTASTFHTTTERLLDNETSVYWFDVGGTMYGISESGGDATAVDAFGWPLPEGDAKNAVLRECIVTDAMRDNI